MEQKRKKLFCEMNPLFYAISAQKEVLKRHLKDIAGNDTFAKAQSDTAPPCVVSSYSSHIIKRGKGIDPILQQNKAVNINIACKKINGITVAPGETFSFCRTVGKITRRKGYKAGRVIEKNKLKPGIGGGLCNLANTLHQIILHSPMTVTEFHSHSDALAPDEGKRVPFSSGTSVCYNNIDYRFRNDTDRPVQILVWCDADNLYAELRSTGEFPWRYELAEEGHHFAKEGEKYYRISKIYRNTIDRATNRVIDKKLVLDNHSEVMFDPELIPKEQLIEA